MTEESLEHVTYQDVPGKVLLMPVSMVGIFMVFGSWGSVIETSFGIV